MDISNHRPRYCRPLIPCFFPSSNRNYDQYFGEHLPDSNLFSPFYTMLYYRPYLWRFPNWWESGMSEVRMDRDRFVISLDVKRFSPDELTVKLNDDFIEIHGKHDERQNEHRIVAKEFYRKFKIPAGVDPESITSFLSSDGFLTICTSRRVLDITCEEKSPAQK